MQTTVAIVPSAPRTFEGIGGGDNERSARRIETVSDVRAVLDSPAASFTELMDCVSVAKAASEWELRHRAAERAFADVVLETPSAQASLSTAAKVVIDNFFKSARSIDHLASRVTAADRWLQHHRTKLDACGASWFADEQAQLLAEIQVLLSDVEPAAQVRLCARLRKIDRPDLGIEAVRPIANKDRDNVAALTTLGAAYCDIGEYGNAERALRAALRVDPKGGQTRVALSRVLQETNRQVEALHLAKIAFADESNIYTAHRLLAAAAALGDSDAFDEAVTAVELAAETESAGQPDVYLLLLAAEALIDQGKAVELGDIVRRISESGTALAGDTAKRFAAAKRALQTLTAPRLFPDGPSPGVTMKQTPGRAVSRVIREN